MGIQAVLQWPGMRSEYSWLAPHDYASVSVPHQIGVSFTDHQQVVLDREGRGRRIDVRAGMVFATGPQTWTWTEVREPTEALEIFPDRSLLDKEIEPVVGGADPVVLCVAATLKRAHVAGTELDDVHAGTLAHICSPLTWTATTAGTGSRSGYSAGDWTEASFAGWRT